jgi:thiamine-phosphate diphosphorylase
VIPRLHLVTDDEILRRQGFAELARRIMEVGGAELALHLRGPRTSGRALFELARELQAGARGSGSLLLINDRVDIGVVLRLSGAHLGQRSLPPRVARDLLGADPVLGLSVHGAAEIPPGEWKGPTEGQVAPRDPAGPERPLPLDFLIVGALFPTSSHPGQAPGGVKRLGEARAVSSLPLIGIGGVTPDRVEAIMASGAHGVAVRGGIWDSEDPFAATRVYLDEVREE